MAFALFIVGFMLLISSIRNTQNDLFNLVTGDFTGPNNFIYWFLSILLIGAIGYIPKLKSFSVAFLVLVVLVLILTRGNPSGVGGGFFEKFSQQLGVTQKVSTQTSTQSSTITTGPNLSLPKLPSIFQ